MSDELLDAGTVRKLIEEKGLKQTWVIQQLGLKRTTGYLMMREGLLPKDAATRNKALGKLSALLGVEVRQILLRLGAKRAG